MLAMTRSRPPQCRQVSMTMANTRLRRCAHVRARCWSVTDASRSPRVLGTTRARSGRLRREHAVDPSQPQPPTASGIGPAGGTVTGSGARVVVPAGALLASTAVAVEQSSQGAPPLPAELTGIGPMFAFTPHGTQFAAPVTVTVPYTESAAAGATPVLYKTNAQNEWEAVSGATFAAGEATASVSSFSWMQVVIPPLVRNEPTRSWTLSLIPG